MNEQPQVQAEPQDASEGAAENPQAPGEAIATAQRRCAWLERLIQRPSGGVNVERARQMLAETQAKLQQLLAGTARRVEPASEASAGPPAEAASQAGVPSAADHRPASSHPAETPQQRAHREAAEKAERRRLHMLRLEECREAQRKGLPTLFVFDPEDGPLPRRGGWF